MMMMIVVVLVIVMAMILISEKESEAQREYPAIEWLGHSHRIVLCKSLHLQFHVTHTVSYKFSSRKALADAALNQRFLNCNQSPV